jgi:hypothetical protein
MTGELKASSGFVNRVGGVGGREGGGRGGAEAGGGA